MIRPSKHDLKVKPDLKDTDLGHFSSLAMQSLIIFYKNQFDETIVKESIAVAKELIKQLKEEEK